MRALGDHGLDEWRRTNALNVFHYGYGRVIPVHYELYADARRYDCVGASVAMPIQIFQGRRDDAVDPASVERWAHARPYVELHVLDDDHQLTASTGYIWDEMRRFLGLPLVGRV
jgi:pimeloyl-ACP methyl ester carboxylesterase